MTVQWNLLTLLGEGVTLIRHAYVAGLRTRTAYGYVAGFGGRATFCILASPRSERRLVVALIEKRPLSDDFVRILLESSSVLYYRVPNTAGSESYLELVKESALQTQLAELEPGDPLVARFRAAIDEKLPAPWCALTRQPPDFPFWTKLCDLQNVAGYGVDLGRVNESIPLLQAGASHPLLWRLLDRWKEYLTLGART